MNSEPGWCPFWHEMCEDGLTETMLKKTKRGKAPIKCRMWKGVAGKDPQTGEVINKYDCAIAWQTTLQLETARVDFSLGGAVESLRNRVNDMAQNLGSMAQMIPLIPQALIEAKLINTREVKQLEKKEETLNVDPGV